MFIYKQIKWTSFYRVVELFMIGLVHLWHWLHVCLSKHKQHSERVLLWDWVLPDWYFKRMQNITLAANSFNKHTKVWDFNPCSFAFIRASVAGVLNVLNAIIWHIWHTKHQKTLLMRCAKSYKFWHIWTVLFHLWNGMDRCVKKNFILFIPLSSLLLLFLSLSLNFFLLSSTACSLLLSLPLPFFFFFLLQHLHSSFGFFFFFFFPVTISLSFFSYHEEEGDSDLK